jgi:hypothetical protein
MQTEPPQADPPKRKRRWFQFSLRTLLIGVTLLAVACWVIVDRTRLIRERDTATQADAAAQKKTKSRERSYEEVLDSYSKLIRHMQARQKWLEDKRLAAEQNEIAAVSVAEVKSRDGWTGESDSPVRFGSSWIVHVWRTPKTPGGFRTLGVAADRRIISYETGK